MAYLPDTIYTFRAELRTIIGAVLVFILLPIAGPFVMSHSTLPTIGLKAAGSALDSQVHVPPPPPPRHQFTEARVLTIWPTKGIVTLEFGAPDPPYESFHTGIDIAGPINQPVVAFMAGKVIAINYMSSGHGTYVEIDHGNGLVSIYAHLSAVTVTRGEAVLAGDMVGKEGETGWATGPHLHFEIRVNNTPVNPRAYLKGQPII